MAHGVQRVGPCVTLVLHVRLDDADRDRLTVRGPVFERPGDRGSVREFDLREVAADLDVRVDSRLDAPVGLQDHPVPEHQGRVALLRPDRGHLQFVARVAPHAAVGARPDGRQPARGAAEGHRAVEQPEQRTRDARIGERVVQDAVVAQAADDRVG